MSLVWGKRMSLHLENEPNAIEPLRDYIDRRVLYFGNLQYAYTLLNKKILQIIS